MVSSPPIVVRIDTADSARIDRLLGAARQRILGSRGSVLALDVGPATLEQCDKASLVSWIDRNAAMLQNHLGAMVLVAPTWTSAFLLRLALRWTPPPVPHIVVRRLEEGLHWAATRR